MSITSTLDVPACPIGLPAPIEPTPSIVELQIVILPIDEIPSPVPPGVPIPIPPPLLNPIPSEYTCDPEIKRLPMEELPSSVEPVPISDASLAPSTIVEFKIATLSTVEQPQSASPVPIPGPARNVLPASIVVFEIVILPIDEVVSNESLPSARPHPIRVR
jgi:hypothetical protein